MDEETRTPLQHLNDYLYKQVENCQRLADSAVPAASKVSALCMQGACFAVYLLHYVVQGS
jgi:hypothetical protein